MNVLVVGGAGFIGSALVPVLQEAGHEVVVVDLFWFGDNLPESTRRVTKDAGELEVHDLAGFDAVIFLAGLSNDPMADFDPYLNFKANASTPAYLAYIARLAGVKTFIHGGSCSVYGHTTDQVMTESCTPLTMSPYGVSKFMAETGVQQQAQQGMRVVCFRMGTVCGYSPRMRFDLILNAMVKDAMTTGNITVFDAEAQRPILDIRDAVKAYKLALENEHFHGVLNIFSYNMRVGDAASEVESGVRKVMGRASNVTFSNGKDIRSYRAHGERVARMGFKPIQWASDTVDMIIKQTDWKQNVEASQFYNIKRFKEIEAFAKSLTEA